MKKRLNVIQINGFKGLVMAAGIVTCLAAGFIGFPGIVMKTIWNFISSQTGLMPEIATLQGILLWGIIVLSYITFRKKPLLVEFKSADDLSREEIDAVMNRIRVERQADIITKAMMRAKELQPDENKEPEHEVNEVQENSKNLS